MSEDGSAMAHWRVVEVVVPSRDASDPYVALSHQLARQLAEITTAAMPDMRTLLDRVQQFAYSGISEALQPIVRQIADINSVSGILARQRETMASITASFEPLPVPTAQELREAEAALRENLTGTPEQAMQVEQLSKTMTTDPRQRELIRRASEALEQASLVLPRRAIAALTAHKLLQDREREAAGRSWQGTNLVFCHEDGTMYSADALNWRFGKMTRKAGIGHWHAHEGRHTAVSIVSSNGVPIQDISDTVGHKSTHVTETVYRHVIRPTIKGGATVMDDVFGDPDDEAEN
jgi:integrase-like protein